MISPACAEQASEAEQAQETSNPALATAIAAGGRTRDIATSDDSVLSTTDMTDRIIAALD